MSRTGGIQLWVPSENSLIPSYTQYAEYRAKKNGYPEINNTDTWSIPSAPRSTLPQEEGFEDPSI